MNDIVKKTIAYIVSAAFVLAGIWLALIAEVSEDDPIDQGSLALLAAIAFCVALLFAGLAGTIKCRKDKK